MGEKKLIKVLVFRVGQEPVVEEIDASLEAKQKLVGGYIECVNIGSFSRFGGKDNVDLWCNEDGKNTGLPFNLRLPVDPMFPDDIIAGDFFLASVTSGGNTKSLSQKMIEKYTKLFKTPAAPAYVANMLSSL